MEQRTLLFPGDMVTSRLLAKELEIADAEETKNGEENAKLFASFCAEHARTLDASYSARNIAVEFAAYRRRAISSLLKDSGGNGYPTLVSQARGFARLKLALALARAGVMARAAVVPAGRQALRLLEWLAVFMACLVALWLVVTVAVVVMAMNRPM